MGGYVTVQVNLTRWIIHSLLCYNVFRMVFRLLVSVADCQRVCDAIVVSLELLVADACRCEDSLIVFQT